MLEAYLMLSNPDKVEPTFLANQLEEDWKKLSPPGKEMIIQQQLNFYASQAGRNDAPQWPQDNKLIVEARDRLKNYPAINRYYKRVTTEINTKVASVKLETISQGEGRDWIIGSYTVPGSFTIDGYREYMLDAIDSVPKEISKEDWVMGPVAPASIDQSTDIIKLQELYYREYTEQWKKFLNGISMKLFKTKDDAVEAIRLLSASNSQMVFVMSEVARQTNLSAAQAGGGISGWIKRLFASKTRSDQSQH